MSTIEEGGGAQHLRPGSIGSVLSCGGQPWKKGQSLTDLTPQDLSTHVDASKGKRGVQLPRVCLTL